MTRKSGFCNTGTHSRCLFLVVNGVRAATRYSACSCDCHDGDPRRLEVIVAEMGHWDSNHPETPAASDVMRYVDAVNAYLASSRGTEAIEADAEGLDDE